MDGRVHCKGYARGYTATTVIESVWRRGGGGMGMFEEQMTLAMWLASWTVGGYAVEASGDCHRWRLLGEGKHASSSQQA